MEKEQVVRHLTQQNDIRSVDHYIEVLCFGCTTRSENVRVRFRALNSYRPRFNVHGRGSSRHPGDSLISWHSCGWTHGRRTSKNSIFGIRSLRVTSLTSPNGGAGGSLHFLAKNCGQGYQKHQNQEKYFVAHGVALVQMIHLQVCLSFSLAALRDLFNAFLDAIELL